MGIPVLVIGESGSGKSTSLRNYNAGDVFVFNVAGKPLPFRKQLDKMDNPGYEQIKNKIRRNEYKRYVIDDSQYLLAFEMFARAKDTGYGKFTDMAIHFKSLIDFVIRNTPHDTIVYFLHHSDTMENGKIKAKTVGKMLDNQLTLEGLFSVVLMAAVEGNNYSFITNSDGASTCKSPMGMFQPRIENDLLFVDNTIREYWNMIQSEPVEPGEQVITKEEWIAICQAGKNNEELIKNAYGAVGYTKPSEIKKKDVEGIITTLQLFSPDEGIPAV